MAEDKLSAREAALIAQARAALGQARVPAAAPAAAPSPATAPGLQAAPAPAPASPGPAASGDAAQRMAALMQAARAEHTRERERLRKFYVWMPLAFISVLGLWTLAWLWTKT